MGGSPKNNLFRRRQEDERPGFFLTLGYVGPRKRWRGGVRKEGWCARMERKGRKENPTSQKKQEAKTANGEHYTLVCNAL
jgi:hypothetical protein